MTNRCARVLLVEDSSADAELMRVAFERVAPWAVLDHVSTGADAMSRLTPNRQDGPTERPALVLLDLRLPDISGHEILAAIRTDDDLATLPVVILSTSSSSTDLRQAQDQGATDYVVKPMRLNNLFALVGDLTQKYLDPGRP